MNKILTFLSSLQTHSDPFHVYSDLTVAAAKMRTIKTVLMLNFNGYLTINGSKGGLHGF